MLLNPKLANFDSPLIPLDALMCLLVISGFKRLGMNQRSEEESMQSGEHMKKPKIWIYSSTRTTRTRVDCKIKGRARVLYVYASVAARNFKVKTCPANSEELWGPVCNQLWRQIV
ncbi:uncharacterized protein DS421_17g587790 [Arachis hypogaea]|nr:uncharacterized protein DS421_17g587790 [Arachis hypogaea]